MKPEVEKYLYDIRNATSLVWDFTSGRSFEEYQSNVMLRSAVERQFEIVGEAISQLAKIDEETASRITEYQRIIAFRNVLIHGYADVDDQIVWGVVTKDLPRLARDVEKLIED